MLATVGAIIPFARCIGHVNDMKLPLGYVIYRGPSTLDGSPIIVIVTELQGTSNRKTGDLVQTWILRDGIHPIDALRNGDDASVCGDCPHRPRVTGPDALKHHNRTCYVNGMVLSAVWRSYVTGKYLDRSPIDVATTLVGRKVRVGSYGDPAAVPFEVWEELLSLCSDNTGYTHQWRNCDKRFASICMASCDSAEDARDARKIGYRAVYVRRDSTVSPIVDNRKFVTCPASNEAGRLVTCSLCMACNGTQNFRKSDITILMH